MSLPQMLKQVQDHIKKIDPSDFHELLAFQSLEELLTYQINGQHVTKEMCYKYLQRIEKVLSQSNQGRTQRDRMLRYLNFHANTGVGRELKLEYQPRDSSIESGHFGKRLSSKHKTRKSKGKSKSRKH